MFLVTVLSRYNSGEKSTVHGLFFVFIYKKYFPNNFIGFKKRFFDFSNPFEKFFQYRSHKGMSNGYKDYLTIDTNFVLIMHAHTNIVTITKITIQKFW